MLSDKWLHHLKPTTHRRLTRLDLYWSMLRHKVDMARQRADYVTPNGTVSRILTSVIKIGGARDLVNAPRITPDMSDAILRMLNDLERPINPGNSRFDSTKILVGAKTPCYEIIVPSRTRAPLRDIPYAEDYNNKLWKSVRPFRIVDMAPSDLSLSFQTDYLRFQKRGPVYAVYTLDAFALITKFFAFYKANKDNRDFDQTVLDFIHHDVMVPSVFDDQASCWIRNVYRQHFIQGSTLQPFSETLWDMIQVDSANIDLAGALFDVTHLKRDLINGVVTPLEVLSTLPLDFKLTSFTGYYTNLVDTVRSPPNGQAHWIDCLKFMTYWEFVILVCSYLPNHPESQILQKDIVRDVREALMQKPWLQVHSTIPYRQMIKTRLEGMYTYLNR